MFVSGNVPHKNTDKSNTTIFTEAGDFKLLFIKNTTTEVQRLKYLLSERYIQFYWVIDQEAKIAFNMPNCALALVAEETAMVFFQEQNMNLLFDIPPKNTVVCLFISLEYFHHLFAEDKSIYFNFEHLKGSKPIISKTQTSSALKMVLHQLLSQHIDDALKSLYLKGKVYEILSLYFSKSAESITTCPFIANEATLSSIKKVKDLIIENMSNPPSLEALAKATGLSLQKMKVGFKNYYGMPIYTFLVNYKMDHAKNLLTESQRNVYEVSEILGYSKPSHFISAFKKKFGITPKRFVKGL